LEDLLEKIWISDQALVAEHENHRQSSGCNNHENRKFDKTVKRLLWEPKNLLAEEPFPLGEALVCPIATTIRWQRKVKQKKRQGKREGGRSKGYKQKRHFFEFLFTIQ
jgi:hypothetical protein